MKKKKEKGMQDKHGGISDSNHDTGSDSGDSTVAGRLTGKVVTRIAPSPTGVFHIGTARTALFNYLFARKHNGLFIVRFEDTDRERSERKYKKDILSALQWLSLHPDVVVQQSDRRKVYRKHIRRMLDDGILYLSKEPSKKDASREVEVVRYKNKKGKISFQDTLRGRVRMDISELGDFVVARGIDDPLYNLAVVIDDMEMGVTHILRGDDHIANTPRQVALIEALGGSAPIYTHMPLIHSLHGGKLSKRKDDVSVTAYRDRGYLSEALINTIALLGWNPKNDQELFTLEELVHAFSPEHLQKKEAVFSEDKLRWFNKQYMKTVDERRLRGGIVPAIIKRFPIRSRLSPRSVKAILHATKERGVPFKEEQQAIMGGEYDFYFTKPVHNIQLLMPKGVTDRKMVAALLRETEALLTELEAYENWTEEKIRDAVWEHAEQNGKANVLWPLRVALSGRQQSPAPFIIAQVLGKKETITRLSTAIDALETA